MSSWVDITTAAAAPMAIHASALANPAASQEAWLLDLVRLNANTAYGRRYGFASLRCYADYARHVPIIRYEDIAADVAALADGATQLLTAEPVICFEETSGSTAGRKLIPYTRSGLRDFEGAALVWLRQLAEACPAMTSGSAYWSISPAARPPARTKSGIPIGFTSDAGYFSPPVGQVLAALSAVPFEAGRLTDIEPWRFLTLRSLLASKALSFISVWSPTFLALLLDAIPALADDLLAAIHDGRPGCDLPFAMDLRPDPHRAQEVAQALRSNDIRQVWPKLAVVSAWSHGSAAASFAALRQRLPGILIDGKGLMATEGVMSISHPTKAFPIPALGFTFVEFVTPDGTGRLAHELEPDVCYRVVTTTRNGLYRYELGDRVACRAIDNGVPQLEFVGRHGIVSDLVGEKLDGTFVAAALHAAGIDGILVPQGRPRARYLLLVDNEVPLPILAGLEDSLAANPHYAYARRLGQLGPIGSRRCDDLMASYQDFRLSQGQRMGDIKPPALLHDLTDSAALLAFLDSRSKISIRMKPDLRRFA
ncbi:MAG TPA: GH3 auxin-responsive promoter family protein [Dongiaceae bacterium]|nr:GH3 auxin-responsive promoter family protein [Dongiaceae bacterium]